MNERIFGWWAAWRLGKARKAGRARDWPAAADAYSAYLHRRPSHAAVWVQLGHALKEQGDFAGARAAYESALKLKPEIADSWLQLGHVLKLKGERAAAVDAYAAAATLDPQLAPAARELIALGARDRLPGGGVADDPIRLGLEADHAHLKAAVEARLDEAGDPTVFAPSRYDAYRHRLVVPAPPRGASASLGLEIVIEARGALAAQVRSTLSSLLDQTHENWRAVVWCPAGMRDHSVASLEALDARIVFLGPEGGARPSAWPDGGYSLLMDAGVVLDRGALAWFAFTATRTGCLAAYCDHDHTVDEWPEGRGFKDPVFQPMADPIWFGDIQNAPAVLLIDGARLTGPGDDASVQARQRLLATAISQGGVAHLPLLLAAVKAIPVIAENALGDPPAAARPVSPSPASSPEIASAAAEAARIQVIIQTRDEPDLLDACVTSLRRTAAQPDLLDLVIVDNRSVEAATGRLLGRLAGERVRILPLDEPFNWSRANNLAAHGGSAPLVLFLNNDTEMLSPGWDSRLREALSPPAVGVVGALLLYPDRTIQHAGMIFGMGVGGPVHEGVGRSGDEAGPGGRWARPRSASGVTGAFLAMRRADFERIGRFDAAAFSIAFNDVDLCLRARQAGLLVLQTPRIQLIHHESKTRGLNATRSRMAWDLEEFALLHRRWGAAIWSDPGYNPHWTRQGHPFDGYRFAGLREVVRHIDQSAAPQPWRAVPADQADETFWW